MVWAPAFSGGSPIWLPGSPGGPGWSDGAPCDCCEPECDTCIDDVTAIEMTLSGYEGNGGVGCGAGSTNTNCSFENLNGTYTLSRVGMTSVFSITGLSILVLTITKYADLDCEGDVVCVGESFVTGFSMTATCDGNELLLSGINNTFDNSTLVGDCGSGTTGDDITLPFLYGDAYTGDPCSGGNLVFGPYSSNTCDGTSAVTITISLLF